MTPILTYKLSSTSHDTTVISDMEMKSTKVQTLGANTICIRDWSYAGEKLSNTTTATGAMRYISTYPGNGYRLAALEVAFTVTQDSGQCCSIQR